MPFVLAHIGHWWTSLLYLAPVVVVGVVLAVSERRARHEEAEGPPATGADVPHPRDVQGAG
jgi:hypothetical protein